jgi:hypothetical protein
MLEILNAEYCWRLFYIRVTIKQPILFEKVIFFYIVNKIKLTCSARDGKLRRRTVLQDSSNNIVISHPFTHDNIMS